MSEVQFYTFYLEPSKRKINEKQRINEGKRMQIERKINEETTREKKFRDREVFILSVLFLPEIFYRRFFFFGRNVYHF